MANISRSQLLIHVPKFILYIYGVVLVVFASSVYFSV